MIQLAGTKEAFKALFQSLETAQPCYIFDPLSGCHTVGGWVVKVVKDSGVTSAKAVVYRMY